MLTIEPKCIMLWYVTYAISWACLWTSLKHEGHTKEACLVWLKKLQSVQQIKHLKQQRFLYFNFYKTQRSYEKNLVYLFIILLVQWWKLCYICIFFTQRMTDFDRLKRNMNDGTTVFLMSCPLNLKHFASIFLI